MNDNSSSYQYLKSLQFNLFRKDLLHTWELTHMEIIALLTTAEILRDLYMLNTSVKLFQSGLAVSLFRDKSTRTRLAYSSACDLLGLQHHEIDEHKSQREHGESVRETATMCSFLTESIGIRDDMFLGKGSAFMKEVASAFEDSYRNAVNMHRPVVINLQSDLDHPTQTLADLLHLKKSFKGLQNLKGRKMVVSWAYSPTYGKPLSVPQGLITLMSRWGMDVVLAYPEGYELMPEIVSKAREFSEKSGGSFRISHTMEEAFQEADAVYPKSWAPREIMERRVSLVEGRDEKALRDLERQCIEENSRHKDWICNEAMMNRTRDALYLHCLPADVQGLNCSDGEVTRGVFEKHRVNTYREASYKAFLIAAAIILSRFENPGELMEKLCLAQSARINAVNA